MGHSFIRHPGPYHLYLIPHSHLDVEWYWTFDKTCAWSRKIFRDTIDLLREHPEETFTQDQVPLLELIADEWGEALARDRSVPPPDDERSLSRRPDTLVGQRGACAARDRSVPPPGRCLGRWIEEGRFEAVCGGYVQPEVAEPHGECLIRSLLLGRKRIWQLFGVAPTTGWFIDTFGQIPQVAQILVGCGITSWVFMRGVPGHLGELPTAFWYESPDGTRILTYWLAAGYGVIHRNLDDALLAEVSHASSPHVMLCWGQDVANPADAPAREARALVEELAAKHRIALSSVKITTPGVYFEHLVKDAADLPVLRYDLAPPDDRFADLRGTYSNRVRLKLANRRAENVLLMAEAWDAVGQTACPRDRSVPPPDDERNRSGRPDTLVGYEGVTAQDWSVPPPDDETSRCRRPDTPVGHDSSGQVLALAWERLLYNHFHDIIGGSCTDQVYEKALRRFGTVVDLSEDVQDRAFDHLARRIDTSRFAYPLVVFNPTSSPRTDVVEFEMVFRDEPTNVCIQDDEGQEVPFVITERRGSRLAREGKMATAHLVWLATEVPGFGYRLYGVEPADVELQAMPVSGKAATAENEWFRITVNPETGDLLSATDRKSGEELLSGPGNEIVARHEEGPSLEGMVRVTGEETRTGCVPGDRPAVDIVSERTALYERVRATTTLLGSRLFRDVTLYNRLPRIHFRTTFEQFRGGDVLVSVRFPVAVSEAAGKLVYETPYAMTERQSGMYHCAQTVVDLSDGRKGLALINTGNAGYWPVGNALDLILFRSLKDFPDYYAPLANEHGTHVFDYVVIPHQGDWRERSVVREGHAVNRPLMAFLTDRHPGEWGPRRSFVEVSPENVEVSAIKRADSGEGIVLRLTETAGKQTEAQVAFGLPVKAAWKATMEEKPAEALTMQGRGTTMSLRPHEIATVIAMPV